MAENRVLVAVADVTTHHFASILALVPPLLLGISLSLLAIRLNIFKEQPEQLVD